MTLKGEIVHEDGKGRQDSFPVLAVRKLPGHDADLCGIAKVRQELLAVFPRKAECADVGIKPCCSPEGCYS